MKITTVAVKSYIKERIIKYSNQLKLNQNDLIDLCLNIAEKNNFKDDFAIDVITKNQTQEINRLIGFLKTQDKNLLQVQENIIYKIEKLNTERKESLNKEDIRQLIELIQKNYGSKDFLIDISFYFNNGINRNNIKEIVKFLEQKRPINELNNVFKNT